LNIKFIGYFAVFDWVFI